MLTECTAAYTKIKGNRFIVKNRDKTYEPKITLYHEIYDGTEILYYEDAEARHAEGINEHGVGILYTTSNFQDDHVDRLTNNVQIIKSALAKKDPHEIIKILTHEDGGVKGMMVVSTPQGTYLVENKADSGRGKKAKKLGAGENWSVITNLPTMLQGATSEKDGESYISSKIRQAVAQAALHGCDTVDTALESLAYKYFAEDSHHNTLRDSEFEQTVMQIGMDLKNRTLHITNVPDKVKKFTKKSSLPDDYEPVCTFVDREYIEPTLAPFRLFTKKIDESVTKFSLVNYLLGDGPERELKALEDRYKSKIQKSSKMKLAQKAANELWEKERILVSLVRKLERDPVFFTAGHTSSQLTGEIDTLSKMIDKIGDDYQQLLNIIHVERYGEPMHVVEESFNRPKKLLTEISKLPKEYFSKIDDAIRDSSFWTKDNSVSSIDAGPKGSLQSPAALSLETALQEAFDNLDLDIDAYVSTFDTDDENTQLNPGHPAYPNRWLIDARWYVSKQRPGRNTVDLQIMPYGEEADPSDVNPSALVRHIAQTVRHELVHYTQMKKQSLKKGMHDDIEAFRDMLKDPKQVPNENNSKYWDVYEPTGNLDASGEEEVHKSGFDQDLYTQDYLKSHIEVDAHAHDAAEELLAVYGLKGSMDLLSKKVDMSDPKLPNAIQHYLEYLPHDSKTVRLLKKKIVAYLGHFTE